MAGILKMCFLGQVEVGLGKGCEGALEKARHSDVVVVEGLGFLLAVLNVEYVAGH